MDYFWRKVNIVVFVLFIVATLTGFGCRRQTNVSENINRSLVVWGLWQDSDVMKPALDAFQAQTGVKVDYKKIASVADYERVLLEALAEGKGPDVFVIHHTWVESKQGLMSPAPSSIIDERDAREEFVDVVTQDVVRDGLVYALPTSVDTLALYFNKDLLNAGGVARAPATWQDAQTAVERLTRVNRVGEIEQAGIALGTAANINRAGDVLQLLMMQSGIPILEEGQAGRRIAVANETGERALTFYTDFADRTKRTYSWNLDQDYSLDAFAEGEAAMMVNYSYHIPTIKAKNPRLNFAIAPMPQIADTQPKNFAAYWPFAVSHTSQAPELAWQFVRILTGSGVAASINQAQGVPPARREDVAAATWARPDISATDTVFNDMIDSVVTGRTNSTNALREAENKLTQLDKREGGI